MPWANAGTYVKDGINDYIVQGRKEGVNPAGAGTKVAAHFTLKVEAVGTAALRLRLTDSDPNRSREPVAGFDGTFDKRRNEADEFYRSITPSELRGWRVGHVPQRPVHRARHQRD